MLLVLSENWTLTGGRADLPAAVRWAREAEDAGFDSVMVSEHIVLGLDAAVDGIMGNPRDYALPGNQDPYTPWPNSLLLLASIASVTERLRLAAAAVLGHRPDEPGHRRGAVPVPAHRAHPRRASAAQDRCRLPRRGHGPRRPGRTAPTDCGGRRTLRREVTRRPGPVE
jgi:hypothetical protein